IDLSLAHAWLTFGLALLIIVAAGVAYTVVPKELMPSEDRGVIYIGARGPEGVGLEYIERQVHSVSDVVQPLLDSGEARLAFSIIGWRDANRALFVLPLADWKDRNRTQQEIAKQLEEGLKGIPGISTWVGAGNSLNIRGGGQGSSVEFALTGPDYDSIYEAGREFIEAIE